MRAPCCPYALTCHAASAPQGERMEGEEQSAEERAAKEFRTVEGVGEAVGMVLAFTTALGGGRHGGLASLRAWVQESGQCSCRWGG